MEELYKVMDDLLDVEFQMKSGIDLLKELEEFYMLEKETEESEARKVAVLMKGYLQSMKSNLREIIRYIDDTTLEKSNNDKKEKQESSNAVSEEVQEFVNLTIGEHMGKAYSEWKLKQDKEPVSEIEKKYQGLLETNFWFCDSIEKHLVWYPSGKGSVCKTVIGWFNSNPHLKRTAQKAVLFFGLVMAKPQPVYI